MQETGYSYGAKLTAVKEVSKLVKLSEKTVRNWVADYDTMLLVQKSQRGKHSKVDSPIMSDPEFKAEFKDFVKSNSRKNGNILDLFHQLRYIFIFIQGEANLTTDVLAEWVNTRLGLAGESQYGSGKYI